MISTIVDAVMVDVSGFLVQLFFIFTIALMVVDKQKPPLTTSILTGVALIVLGFGGSFYSSAVAAGSIVGGILWLILAWQRFTQSTQSHA